MRGKKGVVIVKICGESCVNTQDYTYLHIFDLITLPNKTCTIIYRNGIDT